MSQPPNPKPENEVPKRPQRLLYPSNLTQRHTARLQIQLRRIYQRFRRGELFKMAALLEGEQAIKESFQAQQADVKAYFQRHGITWEGNKAGLEKTLQDTLDGWERIVNDFSSPRNPDSGTQVHVHRAPPTES